MNQGKMYLINKLFNDKTIRTVWDKNEEKYMLVLLMWSVLLLIVTSLESIGIG